MKSRHRAIAMTAIAFTVATGVFSVSPAAAEVYQHPPDLMSKVFRSGECEYRIQYGTYGGAPYAFLRVYTNTCMSTLNYVNVLWHDGTSEKPYRLSSTVRYGADSACGRGFQEMGGPIPRVGYGVGMEMFLYRNFTSNVFRNVGGKLTSGTPCPR